MNVKELREALAAYPDDMEVVVFYPACPEQYEDYYDDVETLRINSENQLVIE